MNTRFATLLVILSALTTLLCCIAVPSTAAPLAKTYLVNDDGDDEDRVPGDGACATDLGACTLNAAISEANLDGVVSTIQFTKQMDISYPDLPPLTEQWTTIDAADQWDGEWPGGRPGVIIGGIGYFNGLLKIEADNIIVRGIEFSGSDAVGINLAGANYATIGGTAERQRNMFDMGSGIGTGIMIRGDSADNKIIGNYFGTWNGVETFPNHLGIDVRGARNIIEHNIIAGHTLTGIRIWSGTLNVIRDNLIGVDKWRQDALANNIGIQLEAAHQNVIGPYNVISANESHGIELRRSDNNAIYGNQIGDTVVGGNGGDGIFLFDSDGNKLGFSPGNDIANNGGSGILIDGAGDTSIRANDIWANGKDGIHIKSGNKTIIGGPNLFEENVIAENNENGIRLSSSYTSSSTILGNVIGLSSEAFDAGNKQHGILIENGSHDNKIGGLGQGLGNRIGWNGWSGIYLTGYTTQNNRIEGNIIGAPKHWYFEAPNGHHGIALYDGAHDNWVGWANTIIASGWSGVAVVRSHDNVIWFNRIGTDGADVNWGNTYYGIHLSESARNEILFNEVAYNGQGKANAGVRVEGSVAQRNKINTNSIHDNGGAGIELISGANANLAAPAVSQASCAGPVSGTSCAKCLVEIFSDTAGEGGFFEAGVTADGGGAFSWSGTPNGPHVTATATDAQGNTSAFSAPANIGVCNAPPTAVFSFTPAEGPLTTTFQFDASASSDKEDPTAALEVRWDWEDDGAFDTEWSTVKTAAHQFAAGDLYTARLEVRDSGGLIDAATHLVHVTEPTAVPPLYLPVIVR